MNEEILNKLHTVLYPISPLASDRERIIEEMGETIWLGSLEKLLLSLDEHMRAEVITLLNDDKLADAIKIIETSGIDVEAIITEVSLKTLENVVNTVK